MRPKVLLTLELKPHEADLGRVMARLSLDESEVDRRFGLVAISPKRNLYSMLVVPAAAARVGDQPPVRRVSSNPLVGSAATR
jgi:hypothetical protein